MKLVHQNNFEVIRLSLATMVVVLHCYDLTNTPYHDYIAQWTGGQITLPYLIIRGFVIMSGYLVLKSLQRSTSVKQYLWRRFLRIYPPLVVMLLIVTLLAGPLYSTLPAGNYFAQNDTWRFVVYSLRVFMVRATPCLPGVFSNNPAGCAVNGSLWTIWIEELLYLGLIAYYVIRRKPRALGITVCITWAVVAALRLLSVRWASVAVPFSKSLQWDYFADLLLYFFSGCAMTLLSWTDMRRARIVFLSAVALAALSCVLHCYLLVGFVLYPAALVACGSDCVPALLRPFRWGNPSYGLYIYSYPIQQMLIQSLHPTAGLLLCTGIPLSFAAGYASWHLIEAPFLRLKDRVQ